MAVPKEKVWICSSGSSSPSALTSFYTLNLNVTAIASSRQVSNYSIDAFIAACVKTFFRRAETLNTGGVLNLSQGYKTNLTMGLLIPGFWACVP